MTPTHETFWNIPLDGVILYPLAAVAVGIFVWALARRIRLWRMGRAPAELGRWGRRAWSFVRLALVDGLAHRRFLRDPYPGVMHLLLFWGALVLLVGTVLDSVSHYFFRFMEGRFYLVASFTLDVLGLLVLAGTAVAAYRRYVQRPDRLDNQPGDACSLALVAAVVLSGYAVEGARLAVPDPGDAGYAAWSPIGATFSPLFQGMTLTGRESWHRVLWYLHFLLALGTIAYVSLTANKLAHIVIGSVNAFLRPLGPRSVMLPIDIEKAETMGAGRIEELRWKDMLDLDSCTRCGRCQDNCPAYLSGKALSPKKVVQDLKAHWLRHASSPAASDEKPAPAMVGEVVEDQVIWDCTSCRSCEEQCPAYIQPMLKILEMRRYLALMVGRLPDTAQTTLRNMQQRGHPWAGSQYLRLRDDWTKEAGMVKLADGQKAETLLWVGCTGAMVDRNVKVTLAVVGLLQRAGVEFGVLGGDETCCGDPARRLGYELQYQEMAQRNIEMFRSHGVRKIVTTCPHCFNVMRKEYPQFGGDFEVVHHSQSLAGLVTQGRLSPASKLDLEATYHDPCFLGRYNDVYRQPRKLLEHVLGARPREMPRSKWRSFCCGGGGGHMWMEEVGGKRINEMRCDEAIATGARVTVTACPYCLQMMETGLERKGARERMQVMDIAEVVQRAAHPLADGTPPAKY